MRSSKLSIDRWLASNYYFLKKEKLQRFASYYIMQEQIRQLKQPQLQHRTERKGSYWAPFLSYERGNDQYHIFR